MMASALPMTAAAVRNLCDAPGARGRAEATKYCAPPAASVFCTFVLVKQVNCGVSITWLCSGGCFLSTARRRCCSSAAVSAYSRTYATRALEEAVAHLLLRVV